MWLFFIKISSKIVQISNIYDNIDKSRSSRKHFLKTGLQNKNGARNIKAKQIDTVKQSGVCKNC